MKPWPTDALIIVAPSPAKAVIDASKPTVERHCRSCCCELTVREETIEHALEMDERHGRPVDFFCVSCAVEHVKGGVDVRVDMRR